eukprot:GCRY01002825.1.p1 GENE.GCRY01002825.1~~GCRY01002825.1.p1  ORF type:complete len:215 (+),score=40.57 GCRY01002825.1:154-798(+)
MGRIKGRSVGSRKRFKTLKNYDDIEEDNLKFDLSFEGSTTVEDNFVPKKARLLLESQKQLKEKKAIPKTLPKDKTIRPTTIKITTHKIQRKKPTESYEALSQRVKKEAHSILVSEAQSLTKKKEKRKEFLKNKKQKKKANVTQKEEMHSKQVGLREVANEPPRLKYKPRNADKIKKQKPQLSVAEQNKRKQMEEIRSNVIQQYRELKGTSKQFP